MSYDPFEPIETARLRLRCVALQDADTTSELMTSDVSRWLANWPLPFTPSMAVERIEAMRALAFKGDALPLALIIKSSNEVAGWTMVNRDIDDRRRGSIGYWLGVRHHGRGYMREVAPAVLAAAFDVLNLDIIEAGAQPENVQSLAIMEACGMRPAGERIVYAPARKREELCLFYEIERPR
jgi:ribosomal-protein-alanine N-acetyltransferase